MSRAADSVGRRASGAHASGLRNSAKRVRAVDQMLHPLFIRRCSTGAGSPGSVEGADGSIVALAPGDPEDAPPLSTSPYPRDSGGGVRQLTAPRPLTRGRGAVDSPASQASRHNRRRQLVRRRHRGQQTVLRQCFGGQSRLRRAGFDQDVTTRS